MPDNSPAAEPATPLAPQPPSQPERLSESRPESQGPGGAPAVEPHLLPVARRPRRRLLALARWTAAVLVFAAFGGATAYAVTQPERTKVPGLKTPDDGRWTFPPLALPKLPAGKPGALDTGVNPSGRHYADLRSLLLPLPEGAVEDTMLPGVKGWVPAEDYVGRFDVGDRAAAGTTLTAQGLRHIAGRAWSMPDGTRTQIYLVQFISTAYAGDYATSAEYTTLTGVDSKEGDNSVESDSLPVPVTVSAYAQTPPYDDTATRYAFVHAGDTLALVVQSTGRQAGVKRGTPAVPFRQTVRLQAQLLG
ncbi:hypothetical protein ABZX65_21045 [Streptomyces sp. NPDC003300]|uniref:hypothetical protein n=1 Tax=unclassified Streptomyces TaxID=2593676 RepID=UPI0033A357B6